MSGFTDWLVGGSPVHILVGLPIPTVNTDIGFPGGSMCFPSVSLIQCVGEIL